ncbi:hypothetical protein SERLADRAFT_477038, partial [Serpula lacrymans var. lacrymans S7.9]
MPPSEDGLLSQSPRQSESLTAIPRYPPAAQKLRDGSLPLQVPNAEAHVSAGGERPAITGSRAYGHASDSEAERGDHEWEVDTSSPRLETHHRQSVSYVPTENTLQMARRVVVTTLIKPTKKRPFFLGLKIVLTGSWLNILIIFLPVA